MMQISEKGNKCESYFQPLLVNPRSDVHGKHETYFKGLNAKLGKLLWDMEHAGFPKCTGLDTILI